MIFLKETEKKKRRRIRKRSPIFHPSFRKAEQNSNASLVGQVSIQETVTLGVIGSDNASTARHAQIRNPQCPCEGSRNWVVIDIDESIPNSRRSSELLADCEAAGSIRVRVQSRNSLPCGRTDEPFASQSTQYLLSSSRSICVSKFWHFSWICLARSFSWRDVILVVVAAASPSSLSFLSSSLSSPSRANTTNHARPRPHGPAAASSPR